MSKDCGPKRSEKDHRREEVMRLAEVLRENLSGMKKVSDSTPLIRQDRENR